MPFVQANMRLADQAWVGSTTSKKGPQKAWGPGPQGLGAVGGWRLGA